MNTFTGRRAIIAVLVLGVSVSAARGQDAPAAQASEPPAIEVTPFIALGSPGISPIGAAIRFPVGANFSIETEVGYRSGEGNINALSSSASLLYDLPRIGRAAPYLAAGVGLQEFGAPIVQPEGDVATQPLVRGLVNAGGGVKVAVNDKWGMRSDARWFKSFGRHASEHWRVAHGVSFDVRRR